MKATITIAGDPASHSFKQVISCPFDLSINDNEFTVRNSNNHAVTSGEISSLDKIEITFEQ